MVMRHIFPYAAVTDTPAGPITVRVAPRYLPEQSDDLEPRHVWSYHVRIENSGTDPVQLLTRHWEITDADGHREVIDGAGVIGEQPVIRPGKAFDYVSGCPLSTSSGTMQGHYGMRSDAGLMDVRVPAFALEHPGHKPTVN